MASSPNLGLTLIEQSQSQKEVTANEAFLTIDALLNTSVISITIATPPSSANAGDLYIIASSATDEWASQEGNLTYYDGSAWNFIIPQKGASFFVADEEVYYFYDGSNWQQQAIISQTTGEFWRARRKEIILSALSGASVSEAGFIPNRSIVFGVHTRVMQAITGATSFSVGISGQTGKYGSGVGAGQDSTNIGVATPEPFFSDTDIILTPAGGNFTAGEVKIVMHYMEFRGAWNW